MAPKTKPIFLKTFSEFTIAELRAMPFSRIFALFFQEVKQTFSNESHPQKPKRSRPAKKNIRKPILVAKVKQTPSASFPEVRLSPETFNKLKSSGFTKAMKRVFTPGPIDQYGDRETISISKQVERVDEAQGITLQKKKEETIVFSKEKGVEIPPPSRVINNQ